MSKLYEKDLGEKISKIFHNIEWSNQRKERLRHLESIQQIMIEQQRNMQDLKEVTSNFEVGKKDIEKKLSDLKLSSESVSKSLWRYIKLIWVLAAVSTYLGWLVYCDGVDYDKLHDEYTQCMNDKNQMIEQFSLVAQQYDQLNNKLSLLRSGQLPSTDIQSDAQEKMSMCEEKMKKLMNQIKGLKQKLKTQLEIQAATKAELLVCEENIETLQRIKGPVETHGNLPNNLADNKRDEPTLSIALAICVAVVVLLLALCCFVATILHAKKSQQKQMGKNMDQYGSVSENIKPDDLVSEDEEENIKPDDLVSEDEEMICCTCETEFTEEVTQFTPAVDKNGSIDNYRFWFQTGGKYRCEITNLIFHVSSPAEVLYHTDQWESHLLNPTGLQPASPLYNIQCPTGSLEFLYLPHCECFTAGDPGPLLAAHVMQDNIELLNATAVSHTHVKIPVSELSPFGLLKKWFSSMVHGQVLLFQKYGRKNRMNVFLLPKNVPLQQVKEQQSFSRFIETSSDCILKKYKNYSISCDLEGEVEIQPLKQVFLCSYGPNFFPTFEMFLDFTVTDLKLKLLEEGNKELWIRRVELLDTSPSAVSNVSAPLVPSPGERLKAVRTRLIEGLNDSIIQSLLDDMLHMNVFNDGEVERVKAQICTKDKASCLIDMVRKKGASASEKLISKLAERDHNLYITLGLHRQSVD